MLKTALVAMTIVGCDCDAKLCEFVSETPAQYASLAECEAAAKAEAIRTPGVDYPLVTGICRSTGTPGAEEPAATELASLEQEDGRTLYDMARDSGGFVIDKTVQGYALVRAGVSSLAVHVKPMALTGWIPAVAN
jgi:hypothetical protein